MKRPRPVTLGEVFAAPHPRGFWGAAQVVRVDGRSVEVVVLDHFAASPPSLDAVPSKPLLRARYAAPKAPARLHVIDPVPPDLVSLGVRAPALPEAPHSGVFGFWGSLAEDAYEEHRWRSLPPEARAAWVANHGRAGTVKLAYAGTRSEHRRDASELHLAFGDAGEGSAATRVRDGTSLDWRVFDALPCLTHVTVEGDHPGLAPWLATRPLVSSLRWANVTVDALDLSAAPLTSLTLEARGPVSVKLPASLDELRVRVRGATPVSFVAAHGGAFLSLSLDVWRDADLAVVRGLSRARALTLEGFESLDLSRVAGFHDVRELNLHGAPGTLSRSDALARFTELRSLTMHRCYDLDAARFPPADAWPALREFSASRAHARDVKAIKSRWKAGVRPSFTAPVDDDAVRATSGFGRYHAMLWKRMRPPLHTVSKVNSSPSMNSSTLISRTWRTFGRARSRSAASSRRNVSAEPAPAMGLMIAG
jgi:hypothetical protein